MLSLSSSYKFYFSNDMVSFGNGINGFSSYVRHKLRHNPTDGSVYVFMSKNRRQLRVIYYERHGYILSTKKLDKGYKFIRPTFDEKKCCYEICWRDFVLVLEGIVGYKLRL